MELHFADYLYLLIALFGISFLVGIPILAGMFALIAIGAVVSLPLWLWYKIKDNKVEAKKAPRKGLILTVHHHSE